MMNDKDFKKRTGEFYTPLKWVDIAHDFIKENNIDIYDDFIVWDCAWGQGNLTKDYKFKNLFASTLLEEDLKNDNNQNSIKFKFDFLNDDIDKIPNLLKEMILENKKIFFLINPPYATSNNAGTDSSHKSGTSNTKLSIKMKLECIDGTQQLFTQFLYQIIEISKKFKNDNIYIGLFSPVNFLTGSSFSKFRKLYLNKFKYNSGFIMKASEFDDIKSDWPLSFTLWEPGETLDQNNFNMIVKDGEKDGEKNIYNLDNNQIKASDWIRTEVKKEKTYKCVQMKSGLSIKDIEGQGRMTEDSFGYLVSGGNNIYKSKTDVYLLTSAYNLGHGVSVTQNNYKKLLSFFTSRIISSKNCNWYSERDEYLKPNIESDLYKIWEMNSVIYSLFNDKSHQTSIRNIKYQSEYHNIHNEFFWIKKNIMKDYINSSENNSLVDDFNENNDRLISNYISINYKNLMSSSKDVIDMATELTLKTINERKFADENLFLNSYDAGWLQIKKILKNDDIKKFKEIYKKLEIDLNQILPELKFLK